MEAQTVVQVMRGHPRKTHPISRDPQSRGAAGAYRG